MLKGEIKTNYGVTSDSPTNQNVDSLQIRVSRSFFDFFSLNTISH